MIERGLEGDLDRPGARQELGAGQGNKIGDALPAAVRRKEGPPANITDGRQASRIDRLIDILASEARS